MKYWFTSDTHFGHANIIKYCGRTIFMASEEIKTYNFLKDKSQEKQRKFKICSKSLAKMDKTIIHNWNQRVKPEDIVFHLGDFQFRNSPGGKKGEGTNIKANYYENQLNGKIILIKGNHDKNNSAKTIVERLVIGYGGKRINLVHNPAHCDINYSINFVGHIHSNWKFKRYRKGENFTDCINVGVDVNKFMPVTFNEIMKEYYKWIHKGKF